VACKYLKDPTFSMVILDELNIILRYDYLSLSDVLPVLQAKPPMQHVVITGRSAKQEVMDAADLVTEMRLVKHPFRKGIKAQQGVEF
jgi:cob(I)alamin adenosyltransferase